MRKTAAAAEEQTAAGTAGAASCNNVRTNGDDGSTSPAHDVCDRDKAYLAYILSNGERCRDEFKSRGPR